MTEHEIIAENKRLKKEVERLNAISEICGECHKKYAEKIERAKSKAIKEFAEKIKEYRNICPMNGKEYICMDIQEINNLVKEME